MHLGNGFPIVGLTGIDIPYPFKMPVVLFDDFLTGSTTDFSKTATGKYLIAGVNSTATSVAIQTTYAIAGGFCRYTTTGASADSVGMVSYTAPVLWSKSSTDPQPWVAQIRANINTITAATQMFGVCPYNGPDQFTTQSASSAQIVVTNGALGYRYMTDVTTVTTTAVVWEDNGTTATIGTGYHTFTVTWDGVATLVYMVDGRVIKRVAVPNFTAALVTVGAVIGTTSAAAKTMDLDYWYLSGTRPKAGV